MRGVHLGLSAAVTLALLGGIAVAGVESGLQPGASAPAFQVRDITGPSAGQSLCYR